MRMICDTTAVNSGLKSGVVVHLQEEFKKRNLSLLQYIGCQHHILDRILNISIDEIFLNKTNSPSMNFFIDKIIQNYVLKNEYCEDGELIALENDPGWRVDFKFLFQLCEALKYYEKSL